MNAFAFTIEMLLFTPEICKNSKSCLFASLEEISVSCSFYNDRLALLLHMSIGNYRKNIRTVRRYVPSRYIVMQTRFNMSGGCKRKL